jgi:hypothetical protein
MGCKEVRTRASTAGKKCCTVNSALFPVCQVSNNEMVQTQTQEIESYLAQLGEGSLYITTLRVVEQTF